MDIKRYFVDRDGYPDIEHERGNVCRWEDVEPLLRSIRVLHVSRTNVGALLRQAKAEGSSEARRDTELDLVVREIAYQLFKEHVVSITTDEDWQRDLITTHYALRVLAPSGPKE